MYKYRTVIRLHLTDAAGVAYFANLFVLAHECYESFLEQDESLGSIIEQKEFIIPIVHAQADYRMPLKLSEKVVIIDSDLRKPRLHGIFGVKNNVGLSTYLIGKCSLAEALKMSSIQNIWLLPSGPIPPNPSEILNSERMKTMLEELKNEFDIIILDSPPLLAAIDSVVLSLLVDAVVLVIKAGKTTNANYLRAHAEIQKAKANIIGVVLNGLRLSQGKYYYKDYYHGGAISQDEM